jgi:hypothetical protein
MIISRGGHGVWEMMKGIEIIPLTRMRKFLFLVIVGDRVPYFLSKVRRTGREA